MEILDYGEPLERDRARITIYPAGHILGSAQILIENDGGRLVYTGDFRTLPAKTVEPLEQLRCDVLIMETTFGRPQYRFPPREQVIEQLLRIITQKLNQGITPVVFVYPLGKGQEILYYLSRSELPVAVDYTILRLARIYEKFGITFGPYEKFRRSEAREKVLLLPAASRMQNFIRNMSDRYLIYMSGWGMDPAAKYRLRVDEVIPFSDHADFDELIRFAEASAAREIYCTHGFEEFVTVLKKRGLNAKPLLQSPQLELFDD